MKYFVVVVLLSYSYTHVPTDKTNELSEKKDSSSFTHEIGR